MQATVRRDTQPEMRIRRILHGMGFRFRVDHAVIGVRRRPDIVFTAKKVAVFVHGCFWHSCPRHRTQPKANAEWWAAKLEANRRRDRAATQQLRRAGWLVLRVWEHEAPDEAAARISGILRAHRLDGRRATKKMPSPHLR